MKPPSSLRRALGVGAAVTILAGCSNGGAQSALGSAAAAPANAGWMAPDAKASNLLYISDAINDAVYVYSYPAGALVGTLRGYFSEPEGECADKRGDVWITSTLSNAVVEYAHGGTSPIATLSEPGLFPDGCSVDPKTGNLAVTNVMSGAGYDAGNIAIYPHGGGMPQVYSDPYVYEYDFCGYDDRSNLFFDGRAPSQSIGAFEFAELPSGTFRDFKHIKLNVAIGAPGGVQWDGKDLAVGDRAAGVIYRFAINGKRGKRVGSTPLTGSSSIGQFWIQGTRVIVPDGGASNRNVGFWNYPAGGTPAQTITGFGDPAGAAVSAQKR